ncbi:lens fiber membrane intrinsic protein-like [Mugil cephalus]|uniref:lens fiber membrane intrinsic protein-like n=1 Tax=Mugil cephalus TaxID=48193 RepID=UPI001FB5DDF3|nr:lens fiber membrane intrinsic protein-like [Mugil cephalus]
MYYGLCSVSFKYIPHSGDSRRQWILLSSTKKPGGQLLVGVLSGTLSLSPQVSDSTLSLLPSARFYLYLWKGDSREGAFPETSFSTAAPLSQLKMYSFMGGGLFCAIVGNILLVVSTATDYWMQYRLSGNYAHQGLWRYCMSNKCYMQTDSIAYWNATRAFMILSGMSCFAGIIAGIMSFSHFSSFERFNRSFAAGIMFFVSTFFVLLGMAIYTGVTINFLGRRFGDWRFSWSYILGWVAMLMNFFAGIFYICAYRMCECRRGTGPR